MSERTDLGRLLARHLAGTASEEERERLERQALEDDRLFDQLEAHESELVDAYVRGELDQEDGRGVARLLDVSTRTRAVADTTLALDVRGDVVATDPPADALLSTRAQAGEGVAPSWGRTRVVAVLLVVAGLVSGWWAAEMRVRAQSTENAALHQQIADQEEQLATLEETNRALALRLARLEAGAP